MMDEKVDERKSEDEDTRDIDPVILKIAETIAREYQPEKIILFGSHAWGTPGPESDVDLFIVKETTTPPLDRMREVEALLWGTGVATDALVYTPEQVTRRSRIGDPFVREILNRGRLLYAR